MKKLIALLLSATMVFSLVGCGGTPSDEKIKAALDDGTITVEDAKAKGWIDDEWVKANFEQIDAGSKIHLFTAFDTTYLDGTPVSSDIIAGKMCLVFFDTAQEDVAEKLKVYNDACDELGKLGTPVLGIVLDENLEAAKENLTDIKFPILVFNDEMQKSLADYSELLDEDVVSVFTKDGGFYTAWNSKETADELVEYAEKLANEA